MNKTTEWALYTDGACTNNGGPGTIGYAFTLSKKVNQDSWAPVTEGANSDIADVASNNRAELKAIIMGLKTLQSKVFYGDSARIYSDSKWSIGAITGKNVDGGGSYNVTKNLDLVKEAKKLLLDIRDVASDVEFVWVRGHDSNEDNNRVDRLAYNICRNL